jgi:hypothetical protein
VPSPFAFLIILGLEEWVREKPRMEIERWAGFSCRTLNLQLDNRRPDNILFMEVLSL